MANSKVEISLQEPDAISGNLSLQLFSEDNGGKTTFYDSDTVILRFFTDFDTPFIVETSYGTASKENTNLRFEQLETIYFNNSNRATLSYLPINSFVSQWIGRPLGSVKREGRTLTLATVGTGVLSVAYNAKYSTVSLSIPRINQDKTAIVIVKQGTEQTTYTVNFDPIKPDYSTGEPIQPTTPTTTTPDGQTQRKPETETRVEYTITVKDYTSNAVLAGVAVSVDGAGRGTTNAQGRLYLGLLTKGQHTLRLTKQGYINSETDGLNNDYFTVA